jgi:hypothetical protein
MKRYPPYRLILMPSVSTLIRVNPHQYYSFMDILVMHDFFMDILVMHAGCRKRMME